MRLNMLLEFLASDPSSDAFTVSSRFSTMLASSDGVVASTDGVALTGWKCDNDVTPTCVKSGVWWGDYPVVRCWCTMIELTSQFVFNNMCNEWPSIEYINCHSIEKKRKWAKEEWLLSASLLIAATLAPGKLCVLPTVSWHLDTSSPHRQRRHFCLQHTRRLPIYSPDRPSLPPLVRRRRQQAPGGRIQ